MTLTLNKSVEISVSSLLIFSVKMVMRDSVTMSQKHLDPLAAFNENSQTVQGQIPARQNSRG